MGFALKMMGFPIVPMILGVVLGTIAEKNLSQALAITTDMAPFFTRPWSLFFITLGAFSIFYPMYQKQRAEKTWTLAFIPIFLMALSPSIFMMEGVIRPVVGVGFLLGGLYLLAKRKQRGWVLEGKTIVPDHPSDRE
ncbi:MAG: hypothetical protein HOG95_04310 [Rhodospirillaceae bacterium]|nr:hypothetical protein [Rhodospirillaceae bacterium]